MVIVEKVLGTLLDTPPNISYPVRPSVAGVVGDLVNDRGEKEYG